MKIDAACSRPQLGDWLPRMRPAELDRAAANYEPRGAFAELHKMECTAVAESGAKAPQLPPMTRQKIKLVCQGKRALKFVSGLAAK